MKRLFLSILHKMTCEKFIYFYIKNGYYLLKKIRYYVYLEV